VPIGHLDFVPGFPVLRFAACKGDSLASVYDQAAAGDPLSIQKCTVICRLCPERNPCRDFALTLTERQRQEFGVIGGIVSVTPKPPPGRPYSSQDQRSRPNVAAGIESSHPEVSAL
jgi:hypothetical protein